MESENQDSFIASKDDESFVLLSIAALTVRYCHYDLGYFIQGEDELVALLEMALRETFMSEASQ